MLFLSRKITVNPIKCSPNTPDSCKADSCKNVGGTWLNNACVGLTQKSPNFCISKGYFDSKPTCPSDYTSTKIVSYSSSSYWECYSKCKPSVPSSNALICGQYGLFYEKPTCPVGQISHIKTGYLPNKGVCYTECMNLRDYYAFNSELETKIEMNTNAYESKTSSVSVVINNASGTGYYVKFIPVGESISTDSGSWLRADSKLIRYQLI